MGPSVLTFGVNFKSMLEVSYYQVRGVEERKVLGRGIVNS